MSLENLLALLQSAQTERDEVVAAQAALSGATGKRDAAQAVLAEKQAAVDAARLATKTEGEQAIAALQALIAAANEEIAVLSSSA